VPLPPKPALVKIAAMLSLAVGLMGPAAWGAVSGESAEALLGMALPFHLWLWRWV